VTGLLVSAFVTLVVVIDPIGVAAIFAALTQRETDAYRVRMAVKGTLIAAGILVLFTLVGDPLLATLGISLAAFRIAGGVLLFLLAIDMVLARDSGLRSTTLRETEEAAARTDISVFPLAIPLIAGPGAITSMLLLTGQSPDGLATVFAVLGVMAFVLVLTLVALLGAARIMRLIGVTGSGVVSRVLGILLAALAVQFVIDGTLAIAA
jgi:multiple antibiotic resistance protein